MVFESGIIEVCVDGEDWAKLKKKNRAKSKSERQKLNIDAKT